MLLYEKIARSVRFPTDAPFGHTPSWLRGSLFEGKISAKKAHFVRFRTETRIGPTYHKAISRWETCGIKFLNLDGAGNVSTQRYLPREANPLDQRAGVAEFSSDKITERMCFFVRKVRRTGSQPPSKESEMNIEGANPTRGDEVGHLENRVQSQLGGRVRDLHLSLRGDALVLRGFARTYYAKQLAQHAVMSLSALSIVANEIEVC